MKWGLGEKDGKLDEHTAGVLVPYMFILMQYTIDQELAKGIYAEFGIKIDGEWGGQWRVTVKDGTYIYKSADNLVWCASRFSLQRCIRLCPHHLSTLSGRRDEWRPQGNRPDPAPVLQDIEIWPARLVPVHLTITWPLYKVGNAHLDV